MEEPAASEEEAKPKPKPKPEPSSWRARERYFPELFAHYEDRLFLQNICRRDEANVAHVALKAVCLALYVINVLVDLVAVVVVHWRLPVARLLASYLLLMTRQVAVVAILQGALWTVLLARHRKGRPAAAWIKRLFLVLHCLSLSLELFLAAVYWTFVHSWSSMVVTTLQLQGGGFFLLLAVDWAASAHPFPLPVVKWAVLFCLAHLLAAWAAVALGGLGSEGQPYLHDAVRLDSHARGAGVVLAGLLLMAVAAYAACWLLVKIRDRVAADRATERF